MRREEMIEILLEQAQAFDAEARVLEASFPDLASKRRRHAAALREAVELVRAQDEG